MGILQWVYKQIQNKGLGDELSLKYVIFVNRDGDAAEKEAQMLINQSKALENAGADMILICSNTTKKTASKIKKHTKVPLLELIPLTTEAALKSGYKRLGLMGTKYVMHGDFYKKIFESHGLEVVSPWKRME